MGKSIKLKNNNYWSTESIVVDNIGTTLKDFLFFKKGESYNYGDNLVSNGVISSGTTILYTTLQTSKSMKNISNISVSGYIYAVRGNNGYIDIQTINTSLDNFTIISTKQDDYHIRLGIKKDSKWNTTNNTLISIQFNGLKLTFS